jgi:hypothetical protein
MKGPFRALNDLKGPFMALNTATGEPLVTTAPPVTLVDVPVRNTTNSHQKSHTKRRS